MSSKWSATNLAHSLLFVTVHPSIHYLSSLSFAGLWSQLSLGEQRGTPWTGRQSVTGPTYRDRQPLTLTFTPTGNLESPVNLTCMSLGCGRKPEYPEKTHAGTRRSCKLHTESPQSAGGFQPRTLLLWDDSASHCTIVPPSSSQCSCLFWLSDWLHGISVCFCEPSIFVYICLHFDKLAPLNVCRISF